VSAEPPAVTPAQGAQDPLGVVLPGMGFGAALGVGLQGLVTFGVDTLKSAAPLTDKPSLGSAHALVLLLGTPAAIALAGLATWRLLASIRNPWRQAMLALVVGLGSFVLSVVLIWPLHSSFGRSGILALVGVAGMICLLIAKRISALHAAV
jgi:hypothetical protein